MTYQAPYSDQKNWSNTYLTDPNLLSLLGPFDLDPCTPTEMPWVTATARYTEQEDGLKQPWSGRVFMNPPYRGVLKWSQKFIQCASGTALLNGRSTETKATQLIMKYSHSIWFPKGRLTFFKENGTPWDQKWFPSLLLGLSKFDTDRFYSAKEIYGGEVFTKEDTQDV